MSRTSRVILLVAHAFNALLLITIATSLFRLDPAPVWPGTAILCIGLLAIARPDLALLVVAGVVPLAAYTLRGRYPAVAWPETLVIAFGAGWSMRRLLRRIDPNLPPAVGQPLVVFACVLLASVVVQMSVDHARLGSPEFSQFMLRYFSRDYFVSGSDRYLHAAAFLLEGLLLLSVSVRVTAADPRLAPRLAGVLAASTAIAAAINLQELTASAARSDQFWRMLAQHISTARLNAHYSDLNAAGSTFAMLLFVSAGLAASARGAARLFAVASVLTAVGLWMSGSRTALFACPIALGFLIVAAAPSHLAKHRQLVTVALSVVLLAAAIAVIYAPTRGNQQASSIAARVRVELARTTLRMVSDQPLFGIGLGEFYARSGEFSSPELLKLFPPAQHENAHNNYLQILAETGLVGLGAFLWLLVAALLEAGRPLSSSVPNALAWGFVAGLLAFLLTCFAGHPLLTREAGYAFWIVVGTAVGHASHAPAGRPRSSRVAGSMTRTTLAAIACLLISIPVRVATAKAHGDFEHLGIGVSPQWERADDGVRYRSAVNTASLFVPGETGFRFRVRALSGAPERLELRLGGRVADVVLLAPDLWTDVAMPARSNHQDARFLRLDLRILEADRRSVTMWITKVEQLAH